MRHSTILSTVCARLLVYVPLAEIVPEPLVVVPFTILILDQPHVWYFAAEPVSARALLSSDLAPPRGRVGTGAQSRAFREFRCSKLFQNKSYSVSYTYSQFVEWHRDEFERRKMLSCNAEL